MSKEEKIYGMLQNLITKDGIGWSKIVEEISKEMKIKNWMLVRGIVQYMMDKKEIKRTDDITKEFYVSL